MELRYGQAIQLKKDIDLSFYCDGILPAGQMGYKETHYKIKFDQATIILPQSLVSELFEEYKIETEKTDLDLSKLKKDALIELVKTAFPDRDYSGLKKDELIEILEGPTDE
jgi:hypothetical protein